MKEHSHRPPFDFDAWCALARRDPAAFEVRRRRYIDAAIGRMPQHQQHRLRAVQWRVDQTRRRAPNPLAACVLLNRMMWESVTGPQGLLAALRGEPLAARRAPVIPLRRHDA